MGYDKYECIFCYTNNRGNNTKDVRTVEICLSCFEKNLGTYLSIRAQNAINDFGIVFDRWCTICENSKKASIPTPCCESCILEACETIHNEIK